MSLTTNKREIKAKVHYLEDLYQNIYMKIHEDSSHSATD